MGEHSFQQSHTTKSISEGNFYQDFIPLLSLYLSLPPSPSLFCLSELFRLPIWEIYGGKMDCVYLHLTEIAINVLSHVPLSVFKEGTG